MKNEDPLPQPNYKESLETVYCLSQRFSNLTFDEVLKNTRKALEKAGFEVISEMAMHEYFKQHLGKDINRYVVLGACHASLAFDLLQAENKLGVLMPCNVIVQDVENGQLMEVSIIDPSQVWKETGDETVKQKAMETKERFKTVLHNIQQTDSSL